MTTAQARQITSETISSSCVVSEKFSPLLSRTNNTIFVSFTAFSQRKLLLYTTLYVTDEFENGCQHFVPPALVLSPSKPLLYANNNLQRSLPKLAKSLLKTDSILPEKTFLASMKKTSWLGTFCERAAHLSLLQQSGFTSSLTFWVLLLQFHCEVVVPAHLEVKLNRHGWLEEVLERLKCTPKHRDPDHFGCFVHLMQSSDCNTIS